MRGAIAIESGCGKRGNAAASASQDPQVWLPHSRRAKFSPGFAKHCVALHFAFVSLIENGRLGAKYYTHVVGCLARGFPVTRHDYAEANSGQPGDSYARMKYCAMKQGIVG